MSVLLGLMAATCEALLSHKPWNLGFSCINVRNYVHRDSNRQ
jgi:hypothetical protein